MADALKRFIFDDYNIRGEWLQLEQSAQEMLSAHDYPKVLADLLLEAAATSLLLASTVKFEGRLSIQLQTPNALNLLLVQSNQTLDYRGIIQFDKSYDYSQETFKELTQNGQLVITIEPDKGQRYQGIVTLEGESLADCIENYFNLSEQLQTRLWFYHQGNSIQALLLQALPDMSDPKDFEHLEILANTLTADESFDADSNTILHRLFHEELIRDLAEQPVGFKCECSKDKMLAAVHLLPEEEITSIIETEGHIQIKCEFCLNQFDFNELDIKQYRAVRGNQTQH